MSFPRSPVLQEAEARTGESRPLSTALGVALGVEQYKGPAPKSRFPGEPRRETLSLAQA